MKKEAGNTEKWYAIYTRSRNEKKVANSLEEKGIQVYLPLLTTIKQWSDRKKKVEIPLFNSYLFVRIDNQNYINVLQTYGVVKFVTFRGERVAIPETQIMAVKAFLEEDDPMLTIEPEFIKGERVEVIRGQLRGLTGMLVEFKGKQRVMVEIEGIGHKIVLNLARSLLEKTD